MSQPPGSDGGNNQASPPKVTISLAKRLDDSPTVNLGKPQRESGVRGVGPPGGAGGAHAGEVLNTGSTAPRPIAGAWRRPWALAAAFLIILAAVMFFSTRGQTVVGAGSSPAATAAGGVSGGQTIVSTAALPEGFVCWDGTGQSDLEMCSVPSGDAGLRYVYPDFEEVGNCALDTKPSTTVTYECRLGSRAVLRFRWWESTNEARAHYTKKFLKGRTEPLLLEGQKVGTLGYDLKPVKGIYRMSGFLFGHFSFTAEATTKPMQIELLGRVRIRTPSELKGYAQGTGQSAPAAVHR